MANRVCKMIPGRDATARPNMVRFACLIVAGAIFSSTHPLQAAGADRFATYANPVDLPYRYQVLRRFARFSRDRKRRSGKRQIPPLSCSRAATGSLLRTRAATGTRRTFCDGSLSSPPDIRLTNSAIDGKLYLATSEDTRHIWVTEDPMSGNWRVAAYRSPMSIRSAAPLILHGGPWGLRNIPHESKWTSSANLQSWLRLNCERSMVVAKSPWIYLQRA
ncbi:hypothetical protein EP837_02733 [Sphingobium sp. EP60837]|nr:hypothetical protein EP837_02733 [Sphingobium sp. EP60837]